MTEGPAAFGAAEGQLGIATRGGADSWPSKTNASGSASGADTPVPDEHRMQASYWWQRKNELVDEFVDSLDERAVRPVSVRSSTTLREEACSERHEEGYRGRPWSAVLREFLDWYNGYRFAHLLFRNPDGERVRAPMPNSHQPRYGNRYYARLKSLERGWLADADDPHVVMLTLTASNENSRGGWRCPADHLRDVTDPFREHVRPALHRAIPHDWEYAKVIEHHGSGYGHLHVAVFVDGPVTESDFHPVIDAHLRHCDPAGRAAHDYHDPDPEARPISVNRVDPDLDLDPDANRDDVEAVGNLGSYIAEYIGSHGEDLFERSIEELAFRAVCWTTGTQRVTFSTGAREYIDDDRDDHDDDELDDAPAGGWLPGTTADDLERAAADPEANASNFLEEDPCWSIEGIGRVDPEGESVYDIKRSGVQYREIEGYPDADPPPDLGPATPRPRTTESGLNDWTT